MYTQTDSEERGSVDDTFEWSPLKGMVAFWNGLPFKRQTIQKRDHSKERPFKRETIQKRDHSKERPFKRKRGT